MDNRKQKQERRASRRFEVTWDVIVNGTDRDGGGFDETSRLLNLSSTGAYLSLRNQVNPGAALELQIRVPFKKKNWMKYSAEVLRVERTRTHVGIAVKFERLRPIFS